MSPFRFGDWFFSIESRVASSGELGDDWSSNWSGVRPVINIDPSKITFSGNGTMSGPYVLE